MISKLLGLVFLMFLLFPTGCNQGTQPAPQLTTGIVWNKFHVCSEHAEPCFEEKCKLVVRVWEGSIENPNALEGNSYYYCTVDKSFYDSVNVEDQIKINLTTCVK